MSRIAICWECGKTFDPEKEKYVAYFRDGKHQKRTCFDCWANEELEKMGFENVEE